MKCSKCGKQYNDIPDNPNWLGFCDEHRKEGILEYIKSTMKSKRIRPKRKTKIALVLKNSPSTVVNTDNYTPLANLTEQDMLDQNLLKTLNTTDLKETMLKEMYVLEASLFNQASKESTRMQQIRSILDAVQSKIFNVETLNVMDVKQKLMAYKLLSDNLHDSLGFMMNLHKTVGSGVEVINQIESLQDEKERRIQKEQKLADENVEEKEKDLIEIKEMIMKSLKSRIDKNGN